MPFDMQRAATAQNVALTRKSRNRKIGKIPVSTSGAGTCPPDCPLKAAGCYADGGPLAIFWRAVTDGGQGLAYGDFLAEVESLPPGQLWRHNQAGDLQPDPIDPGTLDHAALMDLAAANIGRRGFTYTHYDVIQNPANRRSIAAANRAGFTVNLSANNLQHADQLAETGAGPVATVLPANTTDKALETPAGRPVAVCPATYDPATSCDRCQLCQRQNRRVIVGFPAHGFRTRKADQIAQGAAQCA